MKILTLLPFALLACTDLFGQIPIPNTQFTLSQRFTFLSNTGVVNPWMDNTAPFLGWYTTESNYRASNGTDNTVSMYSFGIGGSTERSLGAITGGPVIAYGLRLVNQSPDILHSFSLSYQGEQWRQGSLSVDTIKFSYRIANTVTDLTTGTWTYVEALAFLSPITTGDTDIMLNGNDGANRVRLTATLNFDLPAGHEIMLRWQDIDAPGTDDGLAIESVTINSVSLPIELVRFEATASGSVTSLKWSTASESNNDYFDLERSANGLNFTSIGRVDGAGTSTASHDYAFIDYRPKSGKNYYRLRQVDHDGQFSFSPIVSVTIDKTGQVYLSPTVATDRLRLELPEQGAADWQIFDSAGQRIATGGWTDGNVQDEIAVGHLPVGMYYLQVNTVQGPVTKKFWKK